MKPLSELEKNWKERIEKPEEIEVFMSTQARAAFHLAMMRCADELQAWLREADKKLGDYKGYNYTNFVRQEIFGTTRQEGEKCSTHKLSK